MHFLFDNFNIINLSIFPKFWGEYFFHIISFIYTKFIFSNF
jgi:hypothetical protein